MRHLFISLVLLLFAFPAVAQDKTDGVQFPSIAIPPAPAPAQVTKLTANQLYVITSDVPCFVLASPLGLVSINEDAGPIKIRGSFVDGKGIETRTYRQKQVVLIEATGTGTVEILVIIVGKTKAEDVLRKTLDVDNGVGPMPPPGPEPKPDPKPDPKPAPVPSEKLRVLMVHDELKPELLTASQRGIIFGAPMRDWLDANVGASEYRIWDKDVKTVGVSKFWVDAMARPRASVPWIVISGPKGGYEGPLPADSEATKAKILECK